MSDEEEELEHWSETEAEDEEQSCVEEDVDEDDADEMDEESPNPADQ